MKNHVAVMLLLLFAYIPFGKTYAQDEGRSDRFSKESVATSEQHLQLIRQELKQLKNHEWAGEYYYGDGLGVNVDFALAPTSGFVFTWNGCLGLYDVNYGQVQFSGGAIKLLFKYPNNQEGFQGIAPELLPVQWGKRHYLIPLSEMVQFTNAINSGTEPSSLFGGRSGSFLLKRGDEKKRVAGQPEIPKEYLSYILRKPIHAEISAVQNSRVEKSQRITTITINVGSAEGLKQGMELHVHSPSNIYDTARVTTVAEHTAEAIIEQTELTDPTPSIGWSLSTKL
jgi:hypothetical protein